MKLNNKTWLPACALVALVAVACSSESSGGGTPTGTTDAVADGTGTDTSSSSSGGADSTVNDAGSATDAGSADTGSADAGSADAGSADSGPADAGSTDAGSAADSGSTPDAAEEPLKAGCCKIAADCGKGGDCVFAAGTTDGKCKNTAELTAGGCWSTKQCGGKACAAAQVCPCGASCLVPDKPGKCDAGGKKTCTIGGTGTATPCADSGDYCKLPSGCTGTGECTKKPGGCIGNVDPQCGCDGKTHSNACVAASAGQNVKSAGACATTPGPGCCNTDKDCKADTVCFAGPFTANKCMATGSLSAGQCWTDAQCPTGSKCENASACGCQAKCKAADKIGTCSKPAVCVKVDPKAYGLCDMLLGVGWDGSKCVSVSGCSCKEDCGKIFKDKAKCESACVKGP